MPVPGPRTQRGPVPGYDNPEGRAPSFFNRWLTPHPVLAPGQSPGTKVIFLGGFVLAPGQIRRLYKQKSNQIAAQAPYDQVNLTPTPENPSAGGRGVEITRSWRYMASSRYQGAGDNSAEWGAHTVVIPRHVNPTPTIGAGNVRNGPTVRNRLTSFGSRVPTLNGPVEGAQ